MKIRGGKGGDKELVTHDNYPDIAEIMDGLASKFGDKIPPNVEVNYESTNYFCRFSDGAIIANPQTIRESKAVGMWSLGHEYAHHHQKFPRIQQHSMRITAAAMMLAGALLHHFTKTPDVALMTNQLALTGKILLTLMPILAVTHTVMRRDEFLADAVAFELLPEKEKKEVLPQLQKDLAKGINSPLPEVFLTHPRHENRIEALQKGTYKQQAIDAIARVNAINKGELELSWVERLLSRKNPKSEQHR